MYASVEGKQAHNSWCGLRFRGEWSPFTL